MPRDGEDGQDGLSAFQLARKSGFVGTQLEWLASLKGERGLDGKPGDRGDRGEPGLAGPQGEPGTPGGRGEKGLDGAKGDRGERGLRGAKGAAGNDGRDGWTPILAVVSDGERRVHKVTGWAGGNGPEPESGVYLGPDGYVTDIRGATDLRGARGPAGSVGVFGGGGTVGPQGDPGADGVSVVSASIDSNEHLILDLSDESQVDAGQLPAAAGTDYAAITGEPTGFPNRTDSTIAFDEGTREFTITPTGASFSIYLAGQEYAYSTPQSIVIPNTTGAAFIYFDSATGVISQMATFDLSLIQSHAWVAAIYWNATLGLAVLVGDERHGLVMDHATHRDLHQSFGTTWVSGLALTSITSGGDASSNTHAQCGVQDGQINDEDIAHTIVDGSPQDISAILKAPIVWKVGADWHIAAVADYPVMYSGRTGTNYTGASGRLAHNEGGALTEVSNLNFVLAHILATNDIRYPIIAVCGQAEYTTLGNARAAAYTELLALTGLPFTEFKPLGSLVMQTSAGYTNAVKARIRTTDEGGDYIDLRRNLSLGASGAAATDVQREVFSSDTAPTVTYPAINFTSVAGYAGLSLMQVNE